jgi:hypothetical protein
MDMLSLVDDDVGPAHIAFTVLVMDSLKAIDSRSSQGKLFHALAQMAKK